MKDDLGGAVLPYYDLGFTDRLGLGTTWDAENGVLEFNCTGTYNASALQAIKALYEARGGWTVTIVGDELTAVNATLGITVVIGKDDDAGTYTMKVTYAEPFDPTKATDWPAAIKTAFQTECNNFDDNFGAGAVLPYVYLGTASPTIKEQSTGNISIYGGVWNDQILTLAKAAWPTTGATPEWAYEEDIASSAYGDSHYTFTKVFKDAAGAILGTVTCKLTNYSTYVTSGVYRHTARLAIHYKGKFIIPAGATDWSQDTKDLFTSEFNNFDGNFGTGTLPYIYLGTLTEAATKSSYNDYMEIVGGDDTWDDQILANAKIAFAAADGWAETDTTSAGDNWYTFQKSFTNAAGENGTIKVSLIAYVLSGKTTPRLRIWFTPAFRAPAGATTWNDVAGKDSSGTKYDLDAEISAYTNGHTIPFFYIGTKAVTSYTSTYSGYYELEGGNWDDKVIDLAKAAFAADTSTAWVLTDNSLTDEDNPLIYNYSDATTGDKIQVKLKKDGYSTKTIGLYVYFTKGWYAPTPAAWPTAVAADMTTNLGEVFPYFYTGTDAPTSSWDAASSTLTIKGVAWETSFNQQNIFTYAHNEIEGDTAFTSNEWTYSQTGYVKHSSPIDPVYGDAYWTSGTDKMLSEQVKSKDGTKIYTLNMFRYMDDHSAPTAGNDYLKAIIKVSPAYQTPTTAGTWDAATVTSIQGTFGSNVVIPYVFLNGTEVYDDTSSSSVTSATITGGMWDAQFLIDAAGDFTEADGWTMYQDVNPNSASDNSKTFVKKFDAVTDASGTVTTAAQMIGVTLNEDTDCGIEITSYAVNDPAVAGTVGYNDTVKAKIDANTANNSAEIPYFYLGVADASVTASVSSGVVTLFGGTFGLYGLVEADKALGTGWDLVKRNYTDYSKNLTKEKKLANGSTITIALSQVYKNSAYVMQAVITYKSAWDADSTAVAWNSTVAAAFTAKFGADFVMPVIYFGAKDADVEVKYQSSTEVDLLGGAWIDDTFSRIGGQLDKDTADTTNNRAWQWMVAYNYSDPYFYASTKAYDASGVTNGKHITLKIYKSSDKVMMEIYYK